MALKIFLAREVVTFRGNDFRLEWSANVPGPSVVNKENQVIAHFYSIEGWLLLPDELKAASSPD